MLEYVTSPLHSTQIGPLLCLANGEVYDCSPPSRLQQPIVRRVVSWVSTQGQIFLVTSSSEIYMHNLATHSVVPIGVCKVVDVKRSDHGYVFLSSNHQAYLLHDDHLHLLANRVRSIETGHQRIYLLRTDGRLDEYGIAGVTPISLPSRIKTVSASSNHTLILTVDGKVYGYGDNRRGQLGITSGQYFSPTSIPTPEKIVSIHAVDNYSYVTGKSGKEYCSGSSVSPFKKPCVRSGFKFHDNRSLFRPVVT